MLDKMNTCLINKYVRTIKNDPICSQHSEVYVNITHEAEYRLCFLSSNSAHLCVVRGADFKQFATEVSVRECNKYCNCTQLNSYIDAYNRKNA
jgi:hypothetical protein